MTSPRNDFKRTDFLGELAWRGLLYQRTAEEELDEHLATPGRVGYCGFDPTADGFCLISGSGVGNTVSNIKFNRVDGLLFLFEIDHRFIQRFLPRINYDHLHIVSGTGPGNAQPDTASATGNKRYFPFYHFHQCYPFMPPESLYALKPSQVMVGPSYSYHLALSKYEKVNIITGWKFINYDNY